MSQVKVAKLRGARGEEKSARERGIGANDNWTTPLQLGDIFKENKAPHTRGRVVLILRFFSDPPRFIDPLTEQHPEEGSTAEIKCKVEGAEGLEVFWQFNGTTLDESESFSRLIRSDPSIW